jgi:molybdenum cofactor sulfurtransferase
VSSAAAAAAAVVVGELPQAAAAAVAGDKPPGTAASHDLVADATASRSDGSANSSSTSNGWHHARSYSTAAAAAATGRLSAIYLYPIKSCAPQAVTSWPLGPNGLLYDREWALVGPDGSVITQKRLPKMTQLQPEVDLAAGLMRVTAPGVQQQLLVKLQQQQQPQEEAEQQGNEQLVRVCGDTVCSYIIVSKVAAAKEADIDPKAAAAAAASVDVTYDAPAWFTAVLGGPCKLVQQLSNSRVVKQHNGRHLQHSAASSHSSRRNSSSSSSSSSCQTLDGTRVQTLGFANEGQYLLVNQASVDAVAGQLAAAAAANSSSSSGVQLDALRFRPNLVVQGFAPWAEDSWSSIAVGGHNSSTRYNTSNSNHAAAEPCSKAAAAAAAAAARAPVALSVVGACGRCDMIRIDQATGQRHGGQLLSLLARQRRQGGKLNFGLLLAHQTATAEAAAAAASAAYLQAAAGSSGQVVQWLHVGDVVVPAM